MIKLDRSGLMRVVLLTKNYAIKLPSRRFGTKWFLKGLVANCTERETSHLSEHLCPVVFSLPLGLCIVMKRCKVLTEEEYDKNSAEIEANIYFTGVEKKSMSYGWLDNKIVAIDYGEL